MSLGSADITAIEQLVAGFAHLVDTGAGDRFATLFVGDGVLEMGATVIEGRPALTAFAAALPDRFPDVRHVVGGVWVDPIPPAAGEAVARAYATVYATDAATGQTVTVSSGTYDDTAVKTDDGWLLSRVRFTRAPA